MLLVKQKLDESYDLDFQVEVFGTTEKTSDVRFVIEGPEYSIICKCIVENGTIKVNIPKLKGVIPAGIYESTLEVIIGDRIFKPLTEQIEFEPLVEFDVKKSDAKPVKEGVKVTTKTIMTSEDSKVSGIQKQIAIAEAQGYEVTKMKDFFVLKKDGQYHGLVSESKIVNSETPFKTLSALVDHLSKGE